MNFKLTFCIVLLFFASLQTVSGQTAESKQATGVELPPNKPIVANNAISARSFTVEGEKYGYLVMSSNFSNSPKWDTKADDSPLSLKDALKTAGKNLKRFVKNEEDWQIKKIEIEPYQTDIGIHWLYIIEFRSSAKESKPFGESFYILVKMNNEIIEPIKGREVIMGIPGIRTN